MRGNAARSEGSSGNPEESNTMTRKEREWVINSLSFLGPDLARGRLKKLGVTIGKDLYASVKKFTRSACPIYETPDSFYPGRKRHRKSSDIEQEWIKHSQPVSRANSKGENLRIALGGKAKVARSIVQNFKCSTSTAYSYCPEVVVASRKHSDLCLFCEALRKLRLLCIRTANTFGASIDEMGDFAGQGQVREPGTRAAIYLKSFADNDQVAGLLQQIDTLTWHEALGQTLAGSMNESMGNIAVICFDYGGVLKLVGYRGDAADFFNPKTLSYFGIMFCAPKPGGGFDRHYVDIFMFNSSHTSGEAVVCLKRGMREVRARMGIAKNLSQASFFSDKGKHFCSAEMVYGVLFGVTRAMGEVFYTFHARYHGKTVLDAHFSQIKRAVKKTPVAKWPDSKDAAKKLVLDSVGGVPNCTPVFLEDADSAGYCRKKLVVRDISHVQKFHRRTYPYPRGDILKVEDLEIPIRTKDILGGEPEDAEGSCDSADDIFGRRSVTATELCDKIKKQKLKLSYYQKQ